MSSILFTNVTIFDGSGTQPFKGEVLVEGQRIAQVAREGAPIDARQAQHIDGKVRS
jgi:N-acyl-D-aspartate/D-glutamate deacylase